MHIKVLKLVFCWNIACVPLIFFWMISRGGMIYEIIFRTGGPWCWCSLCIGSFKCIPFLVLNNWTDLSKVRQVKLPVRYSFLCCFHVNVQRYIYRYFEWSTKGVAEEIYFYFSKSGSQWAMHAFSSGSSKFVILSH